MQWLYRVELLLRAGGLILLAMFGYQIACYAVFQSRPELLLKLPHPIAPRPIVVGQLAIPRLHVSVVVVEGDDENSLALAAGHVPGTAPIGGIGNSVIAGHRDSAFDELRHVRIGDRIFFRAAKDVAYQVSRIREVDPDDLSVLRQGAHSRLTLITCYPFRYAGPAPRRYVIEAALLN